MRTALSILALSFTACAVFEEPIERDAGRITMDSGGVDSGGVDSGHATVDAGRDSGEIDVDSGGVDAGHVDSGGVDAGHMDAGNDAGRDAGASCIVPAIVALDNCTGDLVINEIDGSGAGMADFVEIYNRGSSPIDISDYVITDGTATTPNVATGVIVPGGTILDPGRFIYVWANLDTSAMPGWQTTNCMPGAPPMCLHSSWGIGASGDFVFILDDSLTIICELQYPTGIFADEAWGRIGDGSMSKCPTNPTPGETNTESTNPARG